MVTTCDDSTPFNHGWATMKSFTLAMFSQQPVAENNYLPQFIGFVTQDQPKELVRFFEGKREPFRKRADEFDMTRYLLSR